MWADLLPCRVLSLSVSICINNTIIERYMLPMYRRPVKRYQHMASVTLIANYRTKISVGQLDELGDRIILSCELYQTLFCTGTYIENNNALSREEVWLHHLGPHDDYYHLGPLTKHDILPQMNDMM